MTKISHQKQVCKLVLHDKQSANVRMRGGDLLIALARHADKVHTLRVECVLQQCVNFVLQQ